MHTSHSHAPCIRICDNSSEALTLPLASSVSSVGWLIQPLCPSGLIEILSGSTVRANMDNEGILFYIADVRMQFVSGIR